MSGAGWSKVPPDYRSQLSQATISALSQFPADWPELELFPLAANETPAANTTNNYATFITILVSPLSRGNVTINSTDTDSPPLISPNWIESVADQEVAIQGFRLLRDIANATGITIGSEIAPGVNTQSDAEILAYIKQTVVTFWHASCTCR